MSRPFQPEPPSVPPDRRRRVQSAQVGLVVLRRLADLGGRASLTQLSQAIDEPTAKVHRYLASLMLEGFVEQDAQTSHYFLGVQAIRVGVAAMRQADPLAAAAPALVRLRERLGATCFVAVMGNLGPTIVRIEEPALPVVVNARVGSVLPLLWSSTGRAFLAFSNDARLYEKAQEEWHAATGRLRALLGRARDPVGLLVRKTQADGVAHVRDAYLPGISAVSAPVRDSADRVCAVLTALGPTGSFDPEPAGRPAREVLHEAQAAAARLGAAAGPGASA